MKKFKNTKGMKRSMRSRVWWSMALPAVGGAWSPAVLFSSGEEGGLYDFTQGYTDTGGTTDAVFGDAIARVDDLSPNGNHITQATTSRRPLLAGVPTELGSELVTNGYFSSDSDWTKGTGWSISGGVATKAAGTASSLTQSISLTAGKLYQITISHTRTAGKIRVDFTGGTSITGDLKDEANSYSEVFLAQSGNNTIEIYGDASFAGDVHGISVKEATATTFSGAYFDGSDDLLSHAGVDLSGSQQFTFAFALWQDNRTAVSATMDVGGYTGTNTAGSAYFGFNTARLNVRDASSTADVRAATNPSGAQSSRIHIGIMEIDYSQAALADQIKINFRGHDVSDTLSGSALSMSGGPNGPIGFGSTANGLYDFRGIIRRGIVIDRLLTDVEKSNLRDWIGGVPVCALLGDSTTAHNTSAAGNPSEVSPAAAYVGAEFTDANISEPGAQIFQQKADWQALGNKANLQAVFVHVGLNDANTYVAKTSAQIIADLQDLIDTVRADVSANCKVYVCALTPSKAWLDAGSVPATASYDHWVAINEAIEGGGSNPITGVDGRITGKNGTSNFWNDLNDGSDNLKSDLDHNGDGVHPSDEGKFIIGSAYRAQLAADGLV